MDPWTFLRTMISSMSDAPDAWEWAIKRFEADDRLRPPQPGAIVFTGSSSITLWDNLARDMAPLYVLNRGFGGSRIAEVARYAPRIVTPCRPRGVVLFAGTNDIAMPHPKAPGEVLAGYRAFVQAARTSLPEMPIYYVSITPTPLRWALWPDVREANRLIAEAAAGQPGLHFIDITGQFLDSRGQPERALYRADRLHPNAAGYARWTAAIKPILLEAFPTQE